MEGISFDVHAAALCGPLGVQALPVKFLADSISASMWYIGRDDTVLQSRKKREPQSGRSLVHCNMKVSNPRTITATPTQRQNHILRPGGVLEISELFIL